VRDELRRGLNDQRLVRQTIEPLANWQQEMLAALAHGQPGCHNSKPELDLRMTDPLIDPRKQSGNALPCKTKRTTATYPPGSWNRQWLQE
jgi:hypothetical protein